MATSMGLQKLLASASRRRITLARFLTGTTTAVPLCIGNLDTIANGQVNVPMYLRSSKGTSQEIQPGIVHIGVGGFHRSHQAMYTCDALAQSSDHDSWGIVGVGCVPADAKMKAILATQDNLFTVLSRGADSTDARIVGSIKKFMLASDDPAAVVTQMALPSTKIVSLTITEKGYCQDPVTKRLDPAHDSVTQDVASPRSPQSPLGLILAALEARRQAGLPPFTVLSCDNLPGNGHVTRGLILELADLMFADSGLQKWIEEEAAFPNCMVDRITPGTTDADLSCLEEDFGVADQWPVCAENFCQWVVEDNFPLGRPAWEHATPVGPESAAMFVPDVEPYELMKLRLLNAGHSSMAYLGYLLGHRTTDLAMADPQLSNFVAQYMHEATPTVPHVPGIDLGVYKATLLERFGNPAIQDQIQRLCEDGTMKMNNFVAPALRHKIHTGDDEMAHAAMVTAAWCKYLTGIDYQNQAIEITDPGAQELSTPALAVVTSKGDVTSTQAFVSQALGDHIGQHGAFVAAVGNAVAELEVKGPSAALEEFLAHSSSS